MRINDVTGQELWGPMMLQVEKQWYWLGAGRWRSSDVASVPFHPLGWGASWGRSLIVFGELNHWLLRRDDREHLPWTLKFTKMLFSPAGLSSLFSVALQFFFIDAGKPDDFVDDVACKMEENTFLGFGEVRCCSVHHHQLFHSDWWSDILLHWIQEVY